MMRVLILMLSFFVSGGTDRVRTTCTAEACLTLHLEEEQFEKAKEKCVNNGGNLVTMRNDNEFQRVKSALLAAEDSILNSTVWIGLELPKSRCTDFTEELHGFKWTSEPNDSKYSKWKKKPLSTCTENRCVSISLADDLKWTDGSCRESAFYMCKFISKGMCKAIVMEEPDDVKYNLPFLERQTQNERLAMLPHGTWAEILCGGSEDTQSFTSFCSDKDGIFGWTNSERFCARNKRSCKHKNGGCDHRCYETAGESVRCECREGYYLMDDQVNCVLRNNCENSPCQSKCIPTSAGFSCACAEGFQLAEDNIRCVDVDECNQRICGKHGCLNTLGSYFCMCNPGFRLVAGKCEDVDECAESRCDQGCLNSQGSFSCFCHTGYHSLSENRGICTDVDECLSKPCEDICLNTLGSFKCSCRKNLILAKNGISCVPDPTEKLQNTPSPDHREAFITQLTQLTTSFESTTINTPPLNKTNTQVDSSKRKESFLSSWIFVYVLASVIPLVVLIILISVLVIWKRSRKETLKNNNADNYCWVSSGLDKERKKINIQLNNLM
ncbi:Complement component C1q receptor [Anabarilius grahami]|uniref:Complement component C1q receptor n=1 Tax=Anabarilius grahami TaxID=495550 RepID=A0A3N0Z1W2_ANAGA|nr:Complement component C1q receptor [Anabarilius grahami]